MIKIQNCGNLKSKYERMKPASILLAEWYHMLSSFNFLTGKIKRQRKERRRKEKEKENGDI